MAERLRSYNEKLFPKSFENRLDFLFERIKSDIEDWNSLNGWAIQKGVSEEKAKELIFNLWIDPDLLSLSEPIAGSIEFYRKLVKLSKYEIAFITVRNCGLREVTLNWMEKYLPEVPKNLINMRDNEKIGGNDFKIGKLEELNIDWHFEDSLEIRKLILSKLKKTNVVHIAYAATEIPFDKKTRKRLIVVPRWEWSSSS